MLSPSPSLLLFSSRLSSLLARCITWMSVFYFEDSVPIDSNFTGDMNPFRIDFRMSFYSFSMTPAIAPNLGMQGHLQTCTVSLVFSLSFCRQTRLHFQYQQNVHAQPDWASADAKNEFPCRLQVIWSAEPGIHQTLWGLNRSQTWCIRKNVSPFFFSAYMHIFTAIYNLQQRSIDFRIDECRNEGSSAKGITMT